MLPGGALPIDWMIERWALLTGAGVYQHRPKSRRGDGYLGLSLTGDGGACGGLFFWSSRQSPQGNGLPCFGHFVAVITFHLGLAISVTWSSHHDALRCSHLGVGGE